MTAVLSIDFAAAERVAAPDFSHRPVAVEVGDVSRSFTGNTVLDSLNLTIHKGEFVALLGASGSGNTTLLRILAGLDAPDGGEAWVPEARTVVFQEPRLVQSMPGPRHCRAARRSAPRSRARWCASRACCCSTNPSRRSMRSPDSRCSG